MEAGIGEIVQELFSVSLAVYKRRCGKPAQASSTSGQLLVATDGCQQSNS
jgi:hypothetical protein